MICQGVRPCLWEFGRARLKYSSDLVRAGVGSAGEFLQTFQPLLLVPAQPLADGLEGGPEGSVRRLDPVLARVRD